MEKSTERAPIEAMAARHEAPGLGRVAEDRARQLLERAAALDAKLSSEVDVAQLREAAAAAGLSSEAFDQALREQIEAPSTVSSAPGRASDRGSPLHGTPTAPAPAEVSHYAGLLRDLLGEDARVAVVDDRIEAYEDDGVTISITPSRGDATVSILAEGRLRRRILAICLPALLPLFLAVLIAWDEEDAAIGVLAGVLLSLVGAVVATVVSEVREQKALRKKTDRLRRQLQRMLGPGPEAS
jgi:hypothetical protein